MCETNDKDKNESSSSERATGTPANSEFGHSQSIGTPGVADSTSDNNQTVSECDADPDTCSSPPDWENISIDAIVELEMMKESIEHFLVENLEKFGRYLNLESRLNGRDNSTPSKEIAEFVTALSDELEQYQNDDDEEPYIFPLMSDLNELYDYWDISSGSLVWSPPSAHSSTQKGGACSMKRETGNTVSHKLKLLHPNLGVILEEDDEHEDDDDFEAIECLPGLSMARGSSSLQALSGEEGKDDIDGDNFESLPSLTRACGSSTLQTLSGEEGKDDIDGDNFESLPGPTRTRSSTALQTLSGMTLPTDDEFVQCAKSASLETFVGDNASVQDLALEELLDKDEMTEESSAKDKTGSASSCLVVQENPSAITDFVQTFASVIIADAIQSITDISPATEGCLQSFSGTSSSGSSITLYEQPTLAKRTEDETADQNMKSRSDPSTLAQTLAKTILADALQSISDIPLQTSEGEGSGKSFLLEKHISSSGSSTINNGQSTFGGSTNSAAALSTISAPAVSVSTSKQENRQAVTSGHRKSSSLPSFPLTDAPDHTCQKKKKRVTFFSSPLVTTRKETSSLKRRASKGILRRKSSFQNSEETERTLAEMEKWSQKSFETQNKQEVSERPTSKASTEVIKSDQEDVIAIEIERLIGEVVDLRGGNNATQLAHQTSKTQRSTNSAHDAAKQPTDGSTHSLSPRQSGDFRLLSTKPNPRLSNPQRANTRFDDLLQPAGSDSGAGNVPSAKCSFPSRICCGSGLCRACPQCKADKERSVNLQKVVDTRTSPCNSLNGEHLCGSCKTRFGKTADGDRSDSKEKVIWVRASDVSLIADDNLSTDHSTDAPIKQAGARRRTADSTEQREGKMSTTSQVSSGPGTTGGEVSKKVSAMSPTGKTMLLPDRAPKRSAVIKSLTATSKASPLPSKYKLKAKSSPGGSLLPSKFKSFAKSESLLGKTMATKQPKTHSLSTISSTGEQPTKSPRATEYAQTVTKTQSDVVCHQDPLVVQQDTLSLPLLPATKASKTASYRPKLISAKEKSGDQTRKETLVSTHGCEPSRTMSEPSRLPPLVPCNKFSSLPTLPNVTPSNGYDVEARLRANYNQLKTAPMKNEEMSLGSMPTPINRSTSGRSHGVRPSDPEHAISTKQVSGTKHGFTRSLPSLPRKCESQTMTNQLPPLATFSSLPKLKLTSDGKGYDAGAWIRNNCDCVKQITSRSKGDTTNTCSLSTSEAVSMVKSPIEEARADLQRKASTTNRCYSNRMVNDSVTGSTYGLATSYLTDIKSPQVLKNEAILPPVTSDRRRMRAKAAHQPKIRATQSDMTSGGLPQIKTSQIKIHRSLPNTF